MAQARFGYHGTLLCASGLSVPISPGKSSANLRHKSGEVKTVPGFSQAPIHRPRPSSYPQIQVQGAGAQHPERESYCPLGSLPHRSPRSQEFRVPTPIRRCTGGSSSPTDRLACPLWAHYAREAPARSPHQVYSGQLRSRLRPFQPPSAL